jgi:hypothetical protein
MVKSSLVWLPGVIRRKRGLPMSRTFASGASLLLLSTLVPGSAASADTQGRARVTIRGTGSAVVIERSEARVTRGVSRATAIPAGPLAEAVHLKAQGASDTAVISYLRAHESEIPSIVDSEDVLRLRKAGAGKSVVAYLTTVAAVAIGATGEGHETAVSAEAVSSIDQETAPYGMSDAYPLSVRYGAPYGARLVHRGFPRSRRKALPPGRPGFSRPVPLRSPFSRRPSME